MSRIVAIGGGEIGRPGYPIETQSIDTEIVNLTGKSRPNLLFLPTASRDDTGYTQVVENYYGKRLGCAVDTLYLYAKPTLQEIKDAIRKADIIYVGGGNTLSMMTKWRKTGLDKLLLRANNKVLAGVSAGAICWFLSGLSDSRRFTSDGKEWSYIGVKGLDMYDLVICPHYDEEINRQSALKHLLAKTNKIAIALENCAALEIIDDNYRIIASKDNKQAYKVFWKQGKYYQQVVKPTVEFNQISELLSFSD